MLCRVKIRPTVSARTAGQKPADAAHFSENRRPGQARNAHGGGKWITITPPQRLSLEDCIAFINDDELVEVTPAAIRLRGKRAAVHMASVR